MAADPHADGGGVPVKRLKFMTSRPMQKISILAVALLVSAGFSLSTAPASEAASCSIQSWGEVDGYHGVYIIYPSITCYGTDLTAISISSMKPDFSHTPTASYAPVQSGASYPGYGVEFNLNDGKYCAFITATIGTLTGPKYESVNHCYTR